ncbi:MAG: thiosulfate oxidation carrier protein SoxY [Betaproteobacteria bacterium]|nr:thiosulfate oxidation carrier protein SoxY [Betaproteobacteria bacterium]NBT74449.1 thiosulfate oxidation carrier protein SoxY [Betaproteobacteria bacterium]NBY13805.1 thiosulfate oxidation carrier protein SoxY [Betaproteobacteria bacterium]NCA16169.1 thiosulfate oxidation carrier protein SoxY [Betaproteobacteria bacterium]
MQGNRREVLKAGGGAALYAALSAMGFFSSSPAFASGWTKEWFETKSIAESFKVMGAGAPAVSADVVITSPDIAENGAVVPVGVASKLAKTEFLAVMVEKNPNMLAGVFQLTPDAEADVSMRVKMGQSSDVYALVKANGKFYMAKKEIKVTLGGCGG